MHDKLVGYVLGALDTDEHEEVKRKLSDDEQLQRHCDLLTKGLEPLGHDGGHYEPPVGLAQRTCELVESHRPGAGLATAADSGPEGAARRWSLLDLAVAAGIVLAASILILPSINHSRFTSRVTACQNKLTQLGSALHRYSHQNGGGFIPEIPDSGALAVAGIYAPKLYEAGFVTDVSTFLCGPGEGCGSEPLEMPTFSDLVKLENDKGKLKQLLQKVGGSYAYNLGFRENNRYQTVSLAENLRPTFVLMADGACPQRKGLQSSNHGGYGQNVLFEDLNVKYLTSCKSPVCGNQDFYHNDDGRVAAGKHAGDAVVGSSTACPNSR